MWTVLMQQTEESQHLRTGWMAPCLNHFQGDVSFSKDKRPRVFFCEYVSPPNLGKEKWCFLHGVFLQRWHFQKWPNHFVNFQELIDRLWQDAHFFWFLDLTRWQWNCKSCRSCQRWSAERCSQGETMETFQLNRWEWLAPDTTWCILAPRRIVQNQIYGGSARHQIVLQRSCKVRKTRIVFDNPFWCMWRNSCTKGTQSDS